MIKIAVICPKYPPIYSGYGNQAKVVFDNIVRDSIDNFHFTILTNSQFNINYENQKNIEVLPIGSKIISKFNMTLGTVLYGMLCFFWLLLNRNKYTQIHCIGAHGATAIPTTLAAKILRKKSIIKITQAEYREIAKEKKIFKKTIRKIRRKIVSTADVFISISEEIKHDLLKYGIEKEKIISIPNGVDETKYHPLKENEKKNLRLKLGINEESLVILYAGALNRRKGTYDLLEAIKLLETTKENVDLILCGPDHENIYNSKINKEVYPVKITYKGKVNNLNDFYQTADAFVLPSYSEGLPNVLLEAGISGLPIIASDIGGNNDIVTNAYSGLLFNPGDVIQLKEKLDFIINNEQVRNRYSKNILKNTTKNFSLTFISEKYINLYKENQHSL